MSAHQEHISGRIRLTRRTEQSREWGHLWVYGGDIEDVSGDPQAGDLIDLFTYSKRFVGRGFFNPHSKIRVRILTFHEEPIDRSFWLQRIQTAMALRARVVSGTNAYRVIHGEADLLPGLVVDRYGDLVVMQTLSFGMDRRKDLLADLVMDATGVKAIYLRNDPKSRQLEGLPIEQGFLRDAAPTMCEISEAGARFLVDVERGQKTGWFCDQRENRAAVATLTNGAEVLEVFCHTGAFGIHALRQGAKSVLGIDVSEESLALARQHAVLNGLEQRCTYRTADAFDELKGIEADGQRYDVIILDPPAFARSKQAVSHALAGYKEINLRALRLVRSGGVVVSCSCSHHVSEPELWATIRAAARDAKRQMRLIEFRSQSRDHPVLAAMPETSYLKCFILQVF